MPHAIRLSIVAKAIFAAALLVAAPGMTAAKAGDACFGVINKTRDTVRVFSKTGSLTYLEIAPRTMDSFCCPADDKLCFDRSDGTTKIKFVRIDPKTPDEWSGDTCRKIYLKPGQTMGVAYDLDGRHIRCAPADPSDHLPDFSAIDLDGDGSVSLGEASSARIPARAFAAVDKDGDGRISHEEWKGIPKDINILKGIPF
ncbi:EF-Hand domain protein [Alkalidesulfovibrio alkalitolerans DSM 16529]|jgi:hypothetical protein|uniref:EF-Hand domain protein n=1 Tax=Alkalidesulfovibrio alkalitolerans DSM 16529 TaxID=1121439 RepID=S7TEY8_9BACT|nr:EF-hand domain-containing protein [Alkalidesulfovibrio alkalitolerans]EPR35742.1 EF-Hand domain protein [Alkalidesulfovibrio alkalitolerans DSM 16529]